MARGVCLCLLLFHLFHAIVAIPLSRYSISEQILNRSLDSNPESVFKSWRVRYQLSHPYNLCGSGSPALYTILVINANYVDVTVFPLLIFERCCQKSDRTMHSFCTLKYTTQFCAKYSILLYFHHPQKGIALIFHYTED